MRAGCQGFTEPNLSTLLYKSKSLRQEDLKYATNVKVFLKRKKRRTFMHFLFEKE